MKPIRFLGIVGFTLSMFFSVSAQDVTVTVNAAQGKRAVSPYIYGTNNGMDKPAAFYNDVGQRFVRQNGGNNATKYNWKRKITSHPDWYNNVYAVDWDKTSKDIMAKVPGMQVMWAFQLIGRVAANTSYNFNDWGYNHSSYWPGVHQNLAGGGVPNETGVNTGKAAVEGNPNLYTMEWPADSTVGILDHWFGQGGIGLNKNRFLYWNMDNEVDIWNGTHDDVMPTQLPATEFMDKYFAVAKKARAIMPEIKLCGPVATSEWQWYKWGNESLNIDGKYYCWLEYFIKRCADEEKASGVRVLDVLDIHGYYGSPSEEESMQLHRIYYDKTYSYPYANGVKSVNGGWNNSITQEYIFQRIEDWLDKHYGPNHGITLGLSEWANNATDPNARSVEYGSLLGTFANHGVELFTPWNWNNGMWETMHLFSRYGKNFSVSSTSSLENTVSAYTTVNAAADSMTVIIVNRDMGSSRNVTVNLSDFAVSDGTYTTKQLSSLPNTETFVSHTNNALKTNTVTVTDNSFSINVPSLSTTAVILKAVATAVPGISQNQVEIEMYPNPARDVVHIKIGGGEPAITEVKLYDLGGRVVKQESVQFDGSTPLTFDVSDADRGIYLVSVKNGYCSKVQKVSVVK